jgi:hypothetical protein
MENKNIHELYKSIGVNNIQYNELSDAIKLAKSDLRTYISSFVDNIRLYSEMDSEYDGAEEKVQLELVITDLICSFTKPTAICDETQID